MLRTAALALLSTASLFCTGQTATHRPPPASSAARHHSPAMTNPEAVHRSAIVIDSHADTPQRFLDEHYDLADPLNGGHLNFESAKQGNLGAEFFSIWVEPDLYKGHYVQRTLELIDSVYLQAEKHPDKMRMAFSPADIETAHREGKLAALMGIEGGHSIDNSLALLRDYYRLGVRYMTLTWSNSNGWADSSGDINDPDVPHTKEGLSEFGKDVVYEMNRLGMMIDVSHVADKTFYRTLILSRAPVIASHSSSRALCKAPRNMTDDMLRALSNNDGVVMVNFFSAFLSEDFRKAWDAQKPERQAAEKAALAEAKRKGNGETYGVEARVDKEFAAKIPRPPFSILIDHIDHMVKVAGIDHVGLGSDFDGIPSTPEGIDSAADLPKITAALMQRGYSAEDCRKILGGNFLRVFRQVEAISRQTRASERPRIDQQQPFSKQPK